MIFADAPDAATVTPGIGGFLTFFALAVVVILLVLNMSKHLRRIDARAAEEEAAATAERERDETAADDAGQADGAAGEGSEPGAEQADGEQAAGQQPDVGADDLHEREER